MSKPRTWHDRKLPAGWNKLREAVFKRDGYRCTMALPLTGRRCPNRRGDAKGTRIECDHVGDNNDHSMANLRTVCQHHHRQRTLAQAVEARERIDNPRKNRLREEAHPGLFRQPNREEA